MPIYGRAWALELRSTRAFRNANSNHQPTIILVGGIVIDGMLLTLFLMLSRANRRAVRFADRMTRELREKADALGRSNADLENFAYVTSHDLKTPLRGIGDLTEYLEEDLTAYMRTNQANPDVRRNIDLARLVERIGSETGLSADQVHVVEPLPVLETHTLRLNQVIGNLVGNAVKYHHDPGQARVTVRSQDIGAFYRISVTDNGPGIDPKFHARIFEVFQTLQTRDEIESTGIGLPIVKKTVESYGGQITVSCAPGGGTTFTFDWPKAIESSEEPSAVVA